MGQVFLEPGALASRSLLTPRAGETPLPGLSPVWGGIAGQAAPLTACRRRGSADGPSTPVVYL
jgi:hypothetical protein